MISSFERSRGFSFVSLDFEKRPTNSSRSYSRGGHLVHHYFSTVYLGLNWNCQTPCSMIRNDFYL